MASASGEKVAIFHPPRVQCEPMTAEILNQRKLRQAIVDAFDESELRTLCFDLKIDYEALPPGSKLDKARELVALCLRDSHIGELVSLCESARPKVDWRGMMATAVLRRRGKIKLFKRCADWTNFSWDLFTGSTIKLVQSFC